MPDIERVQLNDEQVDLQSSFHKELQPLIDDYFLKAWELSYSNDDAPRVAAAMIANVVLDIIAQYALFACECAQRKPSKEQWTTLCSERYDRALEKFSPTPKSKD